MHVFLLYLGLFLGTYLASGGLCWIVLRRSAFPLVAFTVSPAATFLLAVCILSYLGYGHARTMSPSLAAVLAVGGTLFTVLMALRHRRELAQRLRLVGPDAALVLVLGLAGGAAVIWRQILADDLGMFEWLNGEFYNFALFAQAAAGYPVPAIADPWIGMHAALRDGADYLTALVALVSDETPVTVIQLACALFRAGYLALCFTLCFTAARRWDLGRLPPALACLAFALYPFDIWQFQTSWVSANLAASFGILTVVLFAFDTILPARATIVVAIALDYALLLTYPESYLLFKAAAGLVVLERLLAGCQRPLRLALAAQAAGIALNPLLYWRKMLAIASQFGSSSGWATAGDIRHEPLGYLVKLGGFAWVYFPDSSLFAGHWIALPVLALAAYLLVGFLRAARSGKGAILAMPAMVACANGTTYFFSLFVYGSLKLCLWFLWTLPVALTALPGRKPSRRIRTVAILALAALCLGYAVVNWKAARRLTDFETFFPNTETRKVIGLLRHELAGRRILIMSVGEADSFFWFQALSSYGLPLVYGDRRQAEVFGRKDTLATSTIRVPEAAQLMPEDGETVTIVRQHEIIALDYDRHAASRIHDYAPLAEGQVFRCLVLHATRLVFSLQTTSVSVARVERRCTQ